MTDNLLVAQISDPYVSVGAGDAASALALGMAVRASQRRFGRPGPPLPTPS